MSLAELEKSQCAPPPAFRPSGGLYPTRHHPLHHQDGDGQAGVDSGGETSAEAERVVRARRDLSGLALKTRAASPESHERTYAYTMAESRERSSIVRPLASRESRQQRAWSCWTWRRRRWMIEVCTRKWRVARVLRCCGGQTSQRRSLWSRGGKPSHSHRRHYHLHHSVQVLKGNDVIFPRRILLVTAELVKLRLSTFNVRWKPPWKHEMNKSVCEKVLKILKFPQIFKEPFDPDMIPLHIGPVTVYFVLYFLHFELSLTYNFTNLSASKRLQRI